MLGKTEVKVGRPRGDGRHCDLCGCSFPAVRCDKCGSQIFCLSCDDMYHRHPKRRFHLRKAVDPTPTPQARPVLPMKVSQLASAPGDPSKMPLPPPRKKKPGKSFFDSFRRGSPSSDNSPPLPKKEYSWTDRLGSIKKFMSNRPLPPLPKDEDNQEQKSSPPAPRKNDLSFIHKRVDEKPPQLPHRTQAKSPSRKLSQADLVSLNHESQMPDKHAEWASGFGAPINDFRQTHTTALPTQHLNGQVNRDSTERELSSGRFRSRSFQEDKSPPGIPNFPEPPNLSPTMPPDVRGYSTLKRPSSHGQDFHNQSFMSMPGDHFPGMHTSSSVTDIHILDSPTTRGPHQFPNFPIPPHYPHPYPMYPHYPNYPQYFGTSFANLSTVVPNIDGDFSDHSDASSFSNKKHHKHSAFGIKAKRSQSVMYDRMAAYPPQYYPFGGFPPHPPLPGYGAAPWGQSDHPVEAPPSPATSVRSFGRSHRSRHRKKKMAASDNDDEDERLSVRSSPRSRTTSSSDRLRKRKTPKKFERSMSPSSLTSSSEEEETQVMADRLSPEVHTELSQGDGYQTKQDKKKVHKPVKESAKLDHKTKQHGSKMRSISHQKLKADDKNFSPKFKKKEKAHLSSSESMDVNEEQVEPLRKTEENVQDQKDAEMEEESDYHCEEDVKEVEQMDEARTETTLSEGQWQCEHCTFINSGEHRICQVCCKTRPDSVPQPDPISLLVPEIQGSSSAAASPDIPALNTTSESLTSDTAKEYLTPPPAAEDDIHSVHSETEGQNFEKLNSDLEQAEKELSRGLMELMKLKEESDIASAQGANRQFSDDIPADTQTLTQPEPKLMVPEMEASLPELTDKLEVSSEQMNHHPNISKIQNVSSKSIGTDSMNFDISANQARALENLSAPVTKATSFHSYTQDQVSPTNSFSEVAPSSPPSQKDIAGKPALRRDSSCQTYQEENVPQIENEIPPLSRANNIDFQYPYSRADSMKSPQLPPMAPSGYRGFSGRGQGLMHRSHSRSSLFGDRYSDTRAVPPEFDNLGFGFGPSPMYRSLSRSSLTGDYSDPWMSDARSLRRPDFYLSMEELVERRRLETKRAQGLELVRMIREAEQQGFTADDIHVALNNCGKQNPVDWLQTNWRGMVDTVVTLATNYGKDKHENDIGVLSENEARDALRMHKGNIWAAVTECVEGRQRKFLELRARGNFSTKEIVDALTQSEGNVELAYTRLSATTLKPFLMRIWGAGEGVENQDGAVCDPTEYLDPGSLGWPKNSILRADVRYADTERCSDQEDWDDDDDVEEEVSWNEDEEDEMESPENFQVEPQIINREKRGFAANHIATPESDSEYCDAFDPVGDARSATSSSPVDEIFFVSPDPGMEPKKDKKKGTSFLSRLAALRKNKKPQMRDIPEKDDDHIDESVKSEAGSGDSRNITAENGQTEAKIRPSDSNTSNAETSKIYGPLNILKQTFSAIKDSVIGSNNKNEAKHSRSITEARTIIVNDRAGQEALLSEEHEEKANKRNLNSDLLAAHSEQKDEGIRKITAESKNKERETVPAHSTENLKDNSVNKVLPGTPAVTSDVQISNSTTSFEEIPMKQQSSEHSESEDKNATYTPDILQNAQKTSASTSGNKSEESSQILTNTSCLKNVEVKSVIPEMLKQQPQDNVDGSADLKTHVKDGLSVTKQMPPKKSEDDDKLQTEQKCEAVPDKISDGSSNTTVDLPQTSFSKSEDTKCSNEVTMEANLKNDLEGDNLLQNVTSGVADDNNAPIASSINEPDTITKNKDTKFKTKKQRGLRLKLPGAEKTTNSETSKDQPRSDGQKDQFAAKANISSKVHVKLDEKQKALKNESDEVIATATESHPAPAEENSMLHKSQEDHEGEIFPVKPAHGNIDMSEKNEEKSVTGEHSNRNISENEFHDMASKIAEKMENCLEVLKSSEAAYAGNEQNIPSTAEKERDVSAVNETAQSKPNSFHQSSETVKDNVDKIPTTDILKISEDRENKKKPDDAKSPSFPNRNEKLHVDDGNQITDTFRETSSSPRKCSSSDVTEKHTIPDGKTLEQPSASNSMTDGNRGDKFVSKSTSDKSSVRDGDAVSVPKMESAISQMKSSSPSTIHSDSFVEAPVIFPSVKAKTFTGIVNKKAKSQFPESDKKQKDFPTLKTTRSVTQNDKAASGKKDDLDENQTPADNAGTYRDEHATQPHQSETDPYVQSINTSNEEKISSVSSDQRSQTMPDGSKTEPSFSAQTEQKEIDSGESASSEVHRISEEAEEKLPKSEAMMDGAATERRSESKLEREAKEQDTRNVAATTNSEASVSSSSKVSDSQTDEQDTKDTSSSVKSEASTSSKGLDSQAKEQDTKDASANSEASVSALRKRYGDQKNERDTRNSSEEANTEASVPSTSKGDKLNTEDKETTETFSEKEDSVPSSPISSGDKTPASRVEELKNSFRDVREGSQGRSQSPLRPQSPFGRMASLTARKEAIAQERSKEIRKTPTVEKKPWFIEKVQPPKQSFPKRSIKQQLEFERKIRKLVSERKCRTYRKAEIVVQLLELNFAEEEALQAAHECSTLEQAISYLQQECLLCTGMYPVGQIVSMIHCPHKACRECIKAYFTIQIRDRTIMELLCPFCNEPDISDEDVAQDYFNHLDILLKKLVEHEIHELFQRKLRDRVLMKDPNFRWCSQCSSGFIAMPNLKRLICPDCNAITCASCRRPWEREHEGVSCEAFATWKDATDPETQAAGLAKLLQEDGIDCPNCHFRYTLAKGGCMHFRCIQCQHDFCSGCSKPFKMGQKCGVSEYCVKLGLHAHHPRNCLFYLRDKDPEDLQRLLDLNDVDYDKDPPEGMELKAVCQVMEQKETSDGLVDDVCGKEVLESQAGLCRVHYVEYLGQLVNKHKIDPIQIFCNDDLELVLRRASKRLPAKSYRDTEVKYREKLVQLIQEELPLELTEGS